MHACGYLRAMEPTHSHLWYNALPGELPSPWEQGGGEEGYTIMLSYGTYIRG